LNVICPQDPCCFSEPREPAPFASGAPPAPRMLNSIESKRNSNFKIYAQRSKHSHTLSSHLDLISIRSRGHEIECISAQEDRLYLQAPPSSIIREPTQGCEMTLYSTASTDIKRGEHQMIAEAVSSTCHRCQVQCGLLEKSRERIRRIRSHDVPYLLDVNEQGRRTEEPPNVK
jgi:hypothetical protein